MDTKLWILYLSSDLECVSMALHLLMFLMLHLFLPLLKTKKMYKKLYILDIFPLLFLLALVLLIKKSCLVFFSYMCFGQFYIKRYNKRFIHFHVLIFNNIFKQFFLELWMTFRKSCFKKPISSLNHPLHQLY